MSRMDSVWNEAAAAPAGPRIYNLFPSLVGSIERWSEHLGRIAAMGFDWVYVNPFHYPGFSGSLYATKDPYRLNDLFRHEANSDEKASLQRFLALAAAQG